MSEIAFFISEKVQKYCKCPARYQTASENMEPQHRKQCKNFLTNWWLSRQVQTLHHLNKHSSNLHSLCIGNSVQILPDYLNPQVGQARIVRHKSSSDS